MRWLKRLFVGAPNQFAPPPEAAACDGRVEYGGRVLDLSDGARWHDGLPHPDMVRAREWLDPVDDEHYGEAWLAVQRSSALPTQR